MINYETIKLHCEIHGTPLYLYHIKTITHAVQSVQKSFPRFQVIYSIKTNPFAPILQHLKTLGVGIDAASKNESGTRVSDSFFEALITRLINQYYL